MDYIQKFLCFIPLSHVRRKPGRRHHQAETFFYVRESLSNVEPLQETGDPVFRPQLDWCGKEPETLSFGGFYQWIGLWKKLF